MRRSMLQSNCASWKQSPKTRDLQLEAERAVGITHFHQGAPAEARIHLEQGLTHYNQQVDADHAYLYGHDPAISCYSYLAPALWLLGYPDQALALTKAGLHLATQLGHPFSLIHSWLNGAAQVHLMRREYEQAQALSQMAVNTSTKHRFPQWLGFGNVLLGASLAAQGHTSDGIAIIQEGLVILESIHMNAYQGFFRGVAGGKLCSCRTLSPGPGDCGRRSECGGRGQANVFGGLNCIVSMGRFSGNRETMKNWSKRHFGVQ